MGLSFLSALELCRLTREIINNFEEGTEKTMQRGLVWFFLGWYSLKAESQGSQGFETLNPGLRERGKGSGPRNAGECCQACSREGLWAGVLVSPSQRSGLAALRGLSDHKLVSFVRAKGKYECCKTHYTAAVCFRVDTAIKAVLDALGSESHSTYFRSQNEVSIYNVPRPYLIKALHGDSRRIELFNIAHASKFYIASEAGAVTQRETNLCWHVKALYYKTYSFIVQKFCSYLL